MVASYWSEEVSVEFGSEREERGSKFDVIRKRSKCSSETRFNKKVGRR